MSENAGERILTALVGPQAEARQAVTPIENAVNLRIGNVCCAFQCKDAGDYRKLIKLMKLYRGFLTREPADIVIELEGTDHLSQGDLNKVIPESEYFHEENIFRSTGQVASGTYDIERGYIKITGERGLANPDMEGNHLNQLFSLAYYSACKRKYQGHPPAMIMHACGIIRSGWALLFTGPSEAGKTTIAKLCRRRDGEVINDEMLLVSRPDDSSSVTVQSAPLLGKVYSPKRIAAPLRCIFLLKKGSQTTVRDMDRTEAYLRMMRQIITPAYIGQKDKRAVLSLMTEFSDELTRAVPVYELEFSLNKDLLWRVVGELENRKN
jgi:hypothetical protein